MIYLNVIISFILLILTIIALSLFVILVIESANTRMTINRMQSHQNEIEALLSSKEDKYGT